MITIEWHGIRANFDGDGWKLDNSNTPWQQETGAYLLKLLDGFTSTVSCPSEDPYPALTIAKSITNQIGGAVIDYDPLAPSDSSLIY